MNYNPLSPEVMKNPFPYYAELRNEAPVAWIEPLQGWALSRYADVDFALRNPQIFSSSEFTKQTLGDLNPTPGVPWILTSTIRGPGGRRCSLVRPPPIGSWRNSYARL